MQIRLRQLAGDVNDVVLLVAHPRFFPTLRSASICSISRPSISDAKDRCAASGAFSAATLSSGDILRLTWVVRGLNFVRHPVDICYTMTAHKQLLAKCKCGPGGNDQHPQGR